MLTIMRSNPFKQSGVSLIAAIFLIVGLAMLGALMALLVSSQSETTLNELYSAQALYAAQSGVQAAAFKINQSATTSSPVGTSSCSTADTAGKVDLNPGTDAWYEITSVNNPIDGISTCKITVIGYAGGSKANPVSQRQFTVYYNSATLP